MLWRLYALFPPSAQFKVWFWPVSVLQFPYAQGGEQEHLGASERADSGPNDLGFHAEGF
jgi:hypothetical protein